MPRYAFVVAATISLSTEVEAETIEQAIELAQARSVMGLCHQCANGSDAEWSTSGELDCGPPMECELVDLHVAGDATAGSRLFERAAALWAGGDVPAEGET